MNEKSSSFFSLFRYFAFDSFIYQTFIIHELALFRNVKSVSDRSQIPKKHIFLNNPLNNGNVFVLIGHLVQDLTGFNNSQNLCPSLLLASDTS